VYVTASPAFADGVAVFDSVILGAWTVDVAEPELFEVFSSGWLSWFFAVTDAESVSFVWSVVLQLMPYVKVLAADAPGARSGRV
jgi:hypothetical protein